MKGFAQSWEIRNAVQHLNELEQVSQVVTSIEAKYGKMKLIMNADDVVSSETHITIQTLNTCYDLLK
jgi:hypothetical protein